MGARHVPPLPEVARHRSLHPLHRVAVVEQHAGGQAGNGDPPHPRVRVHGRVTRYGSGRFLLAHGLTADDRAVRPHHAGPVEGEPLAGVGVGQLELAPALHALRAEELHDLAAGPAAPTVLLEARHAVREKENVVLAGMLARIHREAVDGVVPHRRIAGGRDVRRGPV